MNGESVEMCWKNLNSKKKCKSSQNYDVEIVDVCVFFTTTAACLSLNQQN